MPSAGYMGVWRHVPLAAAHGRFGRLSSSTPQPQHVIGTPQRGESGDTKDPRTVHGRAVEVVVLASPRQLVPRPNSPSAVCPTDQRSTAKARSRAVANAHTPPHHPTKGGTSRAPRRRRRRQLDDSGGPQLTLLARPCALARNSDPRSEARRSVSPAMQPPACHARLASRRASISRNAPDHCFAQGFLSPQAHQARDARGDGPASTSTRNAHEHAMNGRPGGAAEGQVDSADPTRARIQSPLSSKHLTPSTSCVPCNWAEQARRQRGMGKKCPGHNIPVLGLSSCRATIVGTASPESEQ
ncbi:hypothetical protein VFPFJ_10760 [Purpureocillium lilacinum]|uniref:Uncharacterized protein n=1 Tax=Purpureocillium lilacinum TaxID=33203 RepID=A0A179GE87_PURLI|nr:hypothetical protein VFPFJ_10760 [Purpureocillium lilacinum]OAQ75770.1 hypothetical protein VFPFJ_10760 [Purpureocillium lilacinum]